MFFKISAFLSIFQVILAADSTNGINSTGCEVFAANIYDDKALKQIQEGLDLIQTMNANLRLKIDSLEMTLNQQRNELKAIDSANPNLNDIRGELNQQLAIQRNDLKKYLDEVKAALTTQIESIRSIDSGKTNPTDIRGELNQQSVIQINELRKDMEEIKAALIAQKDSIMSMDSCKTNFTDIRDELYQQLIIQRNDMKEDLVELPKSCAEALRGSGRSGIYKIKIPYFGLKPFNAYCLKDTTNDTSAWLVIQRRKDGSVDFYRSWIDYQQGFGNLEGEFFIGLNKLHALTQSTVHELWIQLKDLKESTRWAKYNYFTVGGESELYALNNLGNYTGDATDSLSYHKGMKWSTYDRDNDHSNQNCARVRRGAYWYKSCAVSNLNGPYLRNINDEGIWPEWNPMHPIKYVHMAIRPVQ